MKIIEVDNEAFKGLQRDIGFIKSYIEAGGTLAEGASACHWMSMEDYMQYDPRHPKKSTVYNWVRNGKIPYHKKDGDLYFLKSDIDKWLMDGKQMDEAMMEQKVVNKLTGKKNFHYDFSKI